MKREAVEIAKRKSVSKKTRLLIFTKAAGRCFKCKSKLLPGWHLEHSIPLWCGGVEDESNYEAWCPECHKAKTSKEASERGHIMRIIRKADPENKKPSQIQSRGFDKSRTKKFNGTVVPRREK